jgi:hypothetical protein
MKQTYDILLCFGEYTFLEILIAHERSLYINIRSIFDRKPEYLGRYND